MLEYHPQGEDNTKNILERENRESLAVETMQLVGGCILFKM